ncbi:conjugative transfer signal peptidase TraF [Brevundimonas vesicularis]|uniref:S26 family signal peptidase n=1 Tax=Brevundimonas vesicularis TaxID=41276 RepID=UPI002782C28A|nr:S26 family signal peptidase [Brevundimonas vesicularis]MDQ1193889.1 conjugative transfer signal peptidase TraF [Brevundimonas vesicularis]
MTRLIRLVIVVGAPVAGFLAIGAIAAQRPAVALINESPSLPLGVYVRTKAAGIERGAVVVLRQPAAVQPYLVRQGMPAEVRLIKRVAATGGDRVCSDGRWLIAPLRTVQIHARDRTGAALPTWRGCRRLAADERLLLGDTPTSLDSRYFGPVTTAQIEGVYRGTLTW